MEAKNIDDIIVASMQDKEVVTPPANDPVQKEPEPVQQEAAVGAIEPEKAEVTAEPEKPKAEKTIDEYGNPIEKAKVYTEDEVNKLIRDRLSRGKYAETPVQPPQVQTQTQTEQEPNWEAELETFVDRTIEKRERKLSEDQWKRQELARQAEFEDKFSSGASKYHDFREVIAGKPITDTMMLATRNLENPAAFIYGAAKMYAKDLERIANMSDPYAQAAEVGRLHEKMIKPHHQISNAPRPIEAVSGDIPAKNVAQFPSLEDRIDQYGRQKQNRK